MSVKVESGKWTTRWAPKKASTAFVQNSLVSLDDGFVTPGDSTTGAADEQALGVYGGPAIASSSTTTDEIPVQVPIGPATIRCTVTGTFASTNLGDGFDLSDDVTVDADANTYKVVNCVRFISSTEGIFVINKTMYSGVA